MMQYIIPVLKLFWCVALEQLTDSKCRPGQGQWALLKLESLCDVIKYRYVSSVLSAQVVGAEGLGFDFRAGQIGTVSRLSPMVRHHCDVFVFPRTVL